MCICENEGKPSTMLCVSGPKFVQAITRYHLLWAMGTTEVVDNSNQSPERVFLRLEIDSLAVLTKTNVVLLQPPYNAREDRNAKTAARGK